MDKNIDYQTIYINNKEGIVLAADIPYKPITVRFDDSNGKIVENDDGSLYFVQKVPLEWVLKQVNDEDKKRINNAIEMAYLLEEKVDVENVTLNSVYR